MQGDTAQALNHVFVNAEGLIFRRGRILPETFALPGHAGEYRPPATYARFLAKNYWLRRGAVDVPSALWITDNVSNNYFHWTIESLPRLLRAERELPDRQTLLLPHHYRRLGFVPFTLRAFPSVERVGWIGGRVKVNVRELAIVPRLPRQPPPRLPDAAELAEVARRVKVLADEGRPARRVYFTRSDARRRRVINEAEVVRLLRQHKFEVVRNDPARPWKQIQASRGAELIVGVHGAALTNLIYMERGANVLELRNPVRHWDVYATLAGIFGVEYHRQDCEPVQAQHEREDPHDVCVDLDLLRESLRSCGVK